MKQILLLSFCFILLSFPLLAQEPEFKVSSFTHESNSMLARMSSNLRMDVNDEAAALILVRTAETGVGFTSNTGIVGETNWKSGDYWVYVSQGARSLKIFKQGIKTIEYTFEVIPQSHETYLLELTVSRPEPKVKILPVTIRFKPADATLSIDGKTISASATQNLSAGEHSIRIAKEGFQPIEKTITVDEKNVFFEWTLEKAQTQWLIINSKPDGADVYINNQPVGKTPYYNELQVGKYNWKLQKELYLVENGVVELFAGTQKQTVDISLKADYGTLSVSTNPEINAEVYINGMSMNKTTPCELEKIPSGEKTIKAIKNLYQITEQLVTVSPESNFKVVLIADPTFGSISVNTSPENGAKVSLDGMPTGKITPCTIEKVPAGDHTLTFSLEMYETTSEQVKVIAGESMPMSITMKPTFAGISVSTNPKADIYINDQYKANGSWKGRLNPGLYTFEGRLDKHHTATEKQTVNIGIPLQIQLNPEPITGTLRVISNPIEAIIKIDGKEYGSTPSTIPNLLIGEYTLSLEKLGHSLINKTIWINENQTTEISETLSTGMEVTINSKPEGAQLIIDGVDRGLTPKTLTLGFGSHNIQLTNGKKVVKQNLEVTQTGPKTFTYDVSELTELTISSKTSYAKIKINNIDQGIAPQKLNLKPGRYLVKANKEGHFIKKRNIIVGDEPINVNMNLTPRGYMGLGWQWGDGTKGLDIMLVGNYGVYLSFMGCSPQAPVGFVNTSGFAFSGQLAFSILPYLSLHGGYGTRIFINKDNTDEEYRSGGLVLGATIPVYLSPVFGFYLRSDYWTKTENGAQLHLSVGIIFRGKG